MVWKCFFILPDTIRLPVFDASYTVCIVCTDLVHSITERNKKVQPFRIALLWCYRYSNGIDNTLCLKPLRIIIMRPPVYALSTTRTILRASIMPYFWHVNGAIVYHKSLLNNTFIFFFLLLY